MPTVAEHQMRFNLGRNSKLFLKVVNETSKNVCVAILWPCPSDDTLHNVSMNVAEVIGLPFDSKRVAVRVSRAVSSDSATTYLGGLLKDKLYHYRPGDLDCRVVA